ncbi:MAG TPA: DUF3152 domain-containing protein [Dermatophilaceae bacterium]|nr:DUF3152 domain-containing protein [Dermatophilaceae bacterium]
MRRRRTVVASLVLVLALLVALDGAGWGSDGAKAGGTTAPAPAAAPAATARAGAAFLAVPAPAARATAGPIARATAGPIAPPSEPPVVERGSGRLRYVALPAIADTAPRGARTVRVALEVEGGTRLDVAATAAAVAAALGDRRGWQGTDRVRFRPVSEAAYRKGGVDVRVTMASPPTVDRLCRPLRTNGQTSCWHGGRAVLNTRRWLTGVRFYGRDLAAYRVYLVNHEVGHGLGHGHASCPRRGAPAPIMLQQTLRLDGCRPNPYPKVA